jgi:LysM repeat protein
MKSVGQLFLGLLTALASSLLVIAAASLSLLEGGGFRAAQQPTNTVAANVTRLATSVFIEATATLIPQTPTPSCSYPQGWIAYTILQSDTLSKLAADWGVSADVLYEKNCLLSESLVVGSTLYHPEKATPTATLTSLATTPVPAVTVTGTATATREQCGPPPGWVPYYVKQGDNLYRVGLAYGITVDLLKYANCLTNDNLRVGQRLYVPNVAPRVPTATPTPTKEPPPPPPASATPITPTNTPKLPPTVAPPTDIPTIIFTEVPTEIPSTAPPTEGIPTGAYPPANQ